MLRLYYGTCPTKGRIHNHVEQKRHTIEPESKTTIISPHRQNCCVDESFKIVGERGVRVHSVGRGSRIMINHFDGHL